MWENKQARVFTQRILNRYICLCRSIFNIFLTCIKTMCTIYCEKNLNPRLILSAIIYDLWTYTHKPSFKCPSPPPHYDKQKMREEMRIFLKVTRIYHHENVKSLKVNVVSFFIKLYEHLCDDEGCRKTAVFCGWECA